MRLLTLIILCFPLFVAGQAENDTVYLLPDTIYRQTFVELVEYEELENHFSCRVYAGPQFHENSQEFADYHSRNFNAGLLAHYSVEGLFAEIGADYTTFNYGAGHSFLSYTTQEYTETLTDTLTSYTTVVDGERTAHYVTRSRNVSRTDTLFYDSLVSFQNRYQFIGIPVYIGTQFSRKKLCVQLSLGVVTQFVISDGGNKAEVYDRLIYENEAPYIKPIVWTAGVKAAVLYELTTRVSVLCSYHFRRQFTSAYSNHPFYLQSHAISAGISLKLF